MIEGNAGTTLLDAVRQWPTPGGWTPESGHWPTPDAAVSNDAEDPESFLERKERTAAAGSGNNGVPFAIAARWATPTTSDGSSGPGTSNAREGGDNLRTQVTAGWATPRATEGEHGGPNGRDSSGSPHLSSQAVAAHVVEAGPEGGRLNPVFVEALMGWALGWTDPTHPAGPFVPFPPPPKGDWAGYLAHFPGTAPVASVVPHRTDRLRACGNGVVPPQAAAALGECFAALAVPAALGMPVAPRRGWRNRWRQAERIAHGPQ